VPAAEKPVDDAGVFPRFSNHEPFAGFKVVSLPGTGPVTVNPTPFLPPVVQVRSLRALRGV